MKVKDVIELARIRAKHSVIYEKTEALIHFINMGIGELYNRFNLSVKSETIITNSDLALYELRSQDVQLILSVYDAKGRELEQSDVLNSLHYDYKIINYKTIMLRKPINGCIYVIYKASPIVLKDLEDEILLPDAMINALLLYIAYLANDTINRDNKNESSILLVAFNEACKNLENQGYQIPINSETKSVQSKGYV